MGTEIGYEFTILETVIFCLLFTLLGFIYQGGFLLPLKGDEVVDCGDILPYALEVGEAVQILGFRTFEVKARPAKKSHNPRIGESVVVSERKVP